MDPQIGLAGTDVSSMPDSALAGLVAARGSLRDLAFEELFKRHYGRLVRFIAGYCGLSRACAEDSAADTFLTLLEKACAFDASKGSFRTWLYRIARNKAADRRRMDRSRAATHDRAALLHPEHTPALTVREHAVSQCLRKLAVDQQQLVVLKYFEGFTEEEIASIMHLQLGTVSHRLSAARFNLRALMNRSLRAGENVRRTRGLYDKK